MSEPFAPIAAKARVLEALRASTSADIPSTAEAVKRALRPDADAAEAEADGGTAQPPLIEQEKQTLELAFRFYMEELLAASNKQGKSVGLEGPVSRHLDLSISLAARDMSDYATPFFLLEDLFDATVISEAEVLFNLVEARAAALAPFLTPEPKFQRAKLALIRSCNELLRRLSKSKNTNFRGRVLMFMAYTFPLAERSGVNLKGASAPSSVEIEAEGAGDDADAMQVDAAPAEAAEAAGAAGAVNYGFYATFWGLQQAFADPGKQVIQTVWPGLVERLQTVLEVFGSFSGSDDVTDEGGVAEPDAAEGTSGGGGGGEAKAGELPEGAALEVYFAKFLTSAKLMTLQLRDGYFRRHVLVQILIFLQTVGTERKGVPPLTAGQRQQADALQARCFELLRAIPPGGARFANAVTMMLEREEHWIKWKVNGCQAFDKAAAAAREDGAPRKRRSTAGGGGGKKMLLGNSALTRLWNMGGNALADIAEKQSEVVPQLSDYLKPVAEQMDPDAGIEEEYKVKNDKAFQWKALRLMAKQDVSLLSKVNASKDAPGVNLEPAVKAYFEATEGKTSAKEEPES